MLKADDMLSQIGIRLSHLNTLPYPGFVAAELSELRFFKHEIKTN